MAFLSLQAVKGGNEVSTTSQTRIKQLEARGLALFDTFSDANKVSEAGSSQSQWSPVSTPGSAIVEANGVVTLTAQISGTNRKAVISTPIRKAYNFFSKPIKLNMRMTQNSDSTDAIRGFSFTSGGDSYTSKDAIIVSVDQNNLLTVKTKRNSTNSFPSTTLLSQQLGAFPIALELYLYKFQYQVTVYDATTKTNYPSVPSNHNLIPYDWGTVVDNINAPGDSCINIENWKREGAANISTFQVSHARLVDGLEDYLAPAVFGPYGDGIDLKLPLLNNSHTLAQYGYVDVTKAPFNADPTGVEDSTQAIQRAADFAVVHNLVCFLPSGTYLVSSTINVEQPAWLRTSATQANIDSGEYFGINHAKPVAIIGSYVGPKPRIILVDNSEGFDVSGNKQKPVVYIWSRNNADTSTTATNTIRHSGENVAMDNVWQNIDIQINAGNPQAVGLIAQGAQGCVVEDTTFDLTRGGHTGLKGGLGSGGSVNNCTFIGGVIGYNMFNINNFDGRPAGGAQPVPPVIGCTFISQSNTPINYGGRGSVVTVGCNFFLLNGTCAINAPWQGFTGGSLPYGLVTMEDCIVEWPSYNVNNDVVRPGKGIVLTNVYARYANNMIKWSGEGSNGSTGSLGYTDYQGNSTGWFRCIEYAKGVKPANNTLTDNSVNPPVTITVTSYEHVNYINGVRAGYTEVIRDEVDVSPPSDLTSKHIWDSSFPHFQDVGVVNVKEAYAITGDGQTDDTALIKQAIAEHPNDVLFFPRGVYRVSEQIVLLATTKIIGCHKSFTYFMAREDGLNNVFGDVNNPNPIFITPLGNGDIVLADFCIFYASEAEGAEAINIRTNGFTVRNVRYDSQPAYGFGGSILNKPNSIYNNKKGVRVTEDAGGKIYGYYNGTSFRHRNNARHVYMENTTNSVYWYGFNPEHCEGEAEAEFVNCRNIYLISYKGEGNIPKVWARDCEYIHIIGYSGNANAYAYDETYDQWRKDPVEQGSYQNYTPSLFRFENCDNFRVVNAVEVPRYFGIQHPVFGNGLPGNEWIMLYDDDGAGNIITTQAAARPSDTFSDRICLYKRGTPIDPPIGLQNVISNTSRVDIPGVVRDPVNIWMDELFLPTAGNINRYWPLTAAMETYFKAEIRDIIDVQFPGITRIELNIEGVGPDNRVDGADHFDFLIHYEDAVNGRAQLVTWAKEEAGPNIDIILYNPPYRESKSGGWATDEGDAALVLNPLVGAVNCSNYYRPYPGWFPFNSAGLNSWLGTVTAKTDAATQFYPGKDVWVMTSNSIPEAPIKLTGYQFKQLVDAIIARGFKVAYWVGRSTVLSDISTGVQEVLRQEPISAPMPTITTAPTTQSVLPGGTLTLTVAGENVLEWWWFKNGTALPYTVDPSYDSRITGYYTDTLQITNVQQSDYASYTARGYGDAGQVISTAAVITQALPAPTISSISPDTSDIAGGIQISITGENLATATDVSINGNTLTGIVVQSDTNITGTIPAGTTGATTIVVTTPWGSDSTTFTYTSVVSSSYSISDAIAGVPFAIATPASPVTSGADEVITTDGELDTLISSGINGKVVRLDGTFGNRSFPAMTDVHFILEDGTDFGSFSLPPGTSRILMEGVTPRTATTGYIRLGFPAYTAGGSGSGHVTDVEFRNFRQVHKRIGAVDAPFNLTIHSNWLLAQRAAYIGMSLEGWMYTCVAFSDNTIGRNCNDIIFGNSYVHQLAGQTPGLSVTEQGITTEPCFRTQGARRFVVADSRIRAELPFPGESDKQIFRIHSNNGNGVDQNAQDHYIVRNQFESLSAGLSIQNSADGSANPPMERIYFHDNDIYHDNANFTLINVGQDGAGSWPVQFSVLRNRAWHASRDSDTAGLFPDPSGPNALGGAYSWSVPTSGPDANLGTGHLASGDMPSPAPWEFISGTTPAQPGTVNLTSTAVTVDEGNTFSITAERVGGTDGTVSVNWTVSGNLSTPSSGTFSWVDGESGTKSESVTAASVVADDSGTITLSGTSLGTSSGTINVDNIASTPASGEININMPAVTVNAGSNFDIIATRSGGTDGAASISWGIIDSTVVVGSGTGTFNWADGEGGDKSVTLTAASIASNQSTLIVVANAVGASAGINYARSLNVIAVGPVVTSVTPNTGSEEGGTDITIEGDRFTGTTGGTINNVALTGFTVDDNNTISATTPAGSIGAQNLVVTAPIGSSAPVTFTYTSVPSARYSVGTALLDWPGGATWGTFNTPNVPSLTDFTRTDVTPAAPGTLATASNAYFRLGAGDYTEGPLGAEFILTGSNKIIELADNAAVGAIRLGYGASNILIRCQNPRQASINRIERQDGGPALADILIDGVNIDDSIPVTNTAPSRDNGGLVSGDRFAYIGCDINQGDFYSLFISMNTVGNNVLVGNCRVNHRSFTAGGGTHVMRAMGNDKLFLVDSWFKAEDGQFRIHNGNNGAADRSYVLRCDIDTPTGMQFRGSGDGGTSVSPVRMGRVRLENTTFRRASNPIIGTVNMGISVVDQPQQFELINCLSMGDAFGSHIQPGASIPTGSTEWNIVNPTNAAYAPLDISTFTWLGSAP